MKCLTELSIDETVCKPDLTILSEQPSRLCDRGAAPDDADPPQDQLARVFVEVDYPVMCMGQAPPFAVNNLVMLAVQQLCSPEAVIWCVGEQNKRHTQSLRDYHGERMVSQPLTPYEHLVAFWINNDQVCESTEWPVFRNDWSCRIFVVDRPNTNTAHLLSELWTNLNNSDAAANSQWDHLYRAVFNRTDMAALCADIQLLVMGDGYHYQIPTIHSSRVDWRQITAALTDVTQAIGGRVTHLHNPPPVTYALVPDTDV